MKYGFKILIINSSSIINYFFIDFLVIDIENIYIIYFMYLLEIVCINVNLFI